jgi:hypothetical protein
LAKLDHRFGELEISEGVSTGGADRFESGFEEGVVRDTKWEFGDHDQL